ncbi:T9SS type A sorting domain-containing protein [Taibaiella chishuiensis]|uniref:Putative secreted protein (Por secretion system target) n=1 Tax=Taibaiella chishuiensis TaxID=1434707 RepID=A0A2P8D233_9BACT|nr:T9SS type A sorting domain-containing protein [Taibaiella chishuiensis]PSK91259.1 putative secreted protein (Por secretion system target) [Taibaiella chishuiensis]
MKKIFKYSLPALLAALFLLGSVAAIAQIRPHPWEPPTPIPARSFTHCTLLSEDCTTGLASIGVNFELNILNLPGFADYRAVIKLYKGVLQSGLASTIHSEVYVTLRNGNTVSVAGIPVNVVTSFTTADFFTQPVSIYVARNGWYRATTTLQRLTSGGWTDVFTTPLSTAYGYDDITWQPFGDFAEVARVNTLRRSLFDFSINGNFCNTGNTEEFFTCATSPLILQDIQDWIGYNTFEASTLKIEKNNGTIWLPPDSIVLSNNQNQSLNLTNLFSLGSYQGLLRVTYELTPDVCNEVSYRRYRQKTIKVTPVTILASYSKPACNNGCGRPVQTTLPITAPAPATNATLSVFQDNIDAAPGWMGAQTVGMYGIHVDGNATVEVYAVDTSGNRISPILSSFSHTGPWTGTLSFNLNNLKFNKNNPPYYVTAGAFSFANYFSKFYEAIQDGDITTMTLADFSDRVYCADLNVVDPVSGCSVSKKSYFKIANNGANIVGSGARPAPPKDEQEVPLSVSIYPNPASTTVTITIPSGTVHASVKLVDNTGRMLLEKEYLHAGKHAIDIQQLPTGVYFYSLSVDGKMKHGKLVKQ